MFTRKTLQHIAAWALFFIYESIMALVIAPPQDWWEPFLFLIPEALYFYGFRHTLQRFSTGYFKTTKWRKLLPLAVSMLLMFAAVTIGMRFLFSHLEQQPHQPGYMKIYVASACFRGIYLSILAFALWLAENIIFKNKLLTQEALRLKEQELEMIQVKSDFVIARNELYKAQIKPHVLFNTLNFVHNQVAESEKASKSILLLTDIMRFALEQDNEGGLVSLEDEWEQVINYIKLQKIRFEKPMYFDSTFMNTQPGTKAPPLVILTLVENIFMHGNLFDANNPALIQLTTDKDSWRLKSQNKKRKNVPDIKGHTMGLDNIKSRLEFHYHPENVTMTVEDNDNSFNLQINVTIPEP